MRLGDKCKSLTDKQFVDKFKDVIQYIDELDDIELAKSLIIEMFRRLEIIIETDILDISNLYKQKIKKKEEVLKCIRKKK